MEQEKEDMKTLGYAKFLLIIGVAFMIIAPFLFTREAFWNKFDFSQTGNIGDTIGGLTAPIINLIGAILVYLALKAQVDANKKTQLQINQQNETESINHLYSNLKSSIDNFNFKTINFIDTEEEEIPYLTGSEAIYKLFDELYCNNSHLDSLELKGNPKITELLSILKICNSLMSKITSSSIPSKEVVKILTCHQFRYRIMPRLELEENLETKYCEDCQKNHGLPKEMVELIKKLKSECITTDCT